jgi:hypothetical protein
MRYLGWFKNKKKADTALGKKEFPRVGAVLLKDESARAKRERLTVVAEQSANEKVETASDPVIYGRPHRRRSLILAFVILMLVLALGSGTLLYLTGS